VVFLALKTIHIVSVVAWMAGLFYLPRLFVYHSDVAVGGEASELFKVMERRLWLAIMVPAAVATWVTGGLAAWAGGYLAWREYWLLAKVVLVVALTGVHLWLGSMRRSFARDGRPAGSRTFRIANEVPTLLLIGIVILVVIRPF
jgi:putative membrane protein